MGGGARNNRMTLKFTLSAGRGVATKAVWVCPVAGRVGFSFMGPQEATTADLSRTFRWLRPRRPATPPAAGDL